LKVKPPVHGGLETRQPTNLSLVVVGQRR
jgi:hypothetical protein